MGRAKSAALAGLAMVATAILVVFALWNRDGDVGPAHDPRRGTAEDTAPRMGTAERAPTASRARARGPAPAPPEDASELVITGRVTGLAADTIARVCARRVGWRDRYVPETLDGAEFNDPVLQFAAPPQAAPVAAETLTDADGRFRLTVADRAAFVVTATAPDGRAASRAADLTAAPQTDVEIPLPPGGCSLRGRVVLPDGSPVRAWLRCLRGEPEGVPPTWRASDADGRFALSGLEPGGTALMYVVDGELSGSAPVVLPRPDEFVVVIGAGPLRTGRVVADPEGAPVAGARVFVSAIDFDGRTGWCNRLMTADGAGAFSFRGSGVLRVRADAPGFGAGETIFSKGEPGELVVRLGRGGMISGHVLRASDASPVGGAVVFAQGDGPLGLWARETTSAEDGTYRFDALPPGAVDVFVLGGGWNSVAVATWEDRTGAADPFAVELAPGGAETCDVRVDAACDIAGRVVDAAGIGVSGATVALRCARSEEGRDRGPRWTRSASVRSADDGTFAFRDLPTDADCRLEAAAPGRPAVTTFVSVSAGTTTNVELRFEIAQRLEVIVLAAGTDARVAGADVDVHAITDDGHFGPVCPMRTTGADGRCVFPDAPDWRLGVVVRASGFFFDEKQPAPATPDAADPRVWRIKVRLAPAFAVTGTLLHADGAPARYEQLTLQSPEDPPGDVRVLKTALTDERGGFRFENVPAGTFSLRTPRDDVALASVTAGGPPIAVRLRDAARCVITIVGPDGAPIGRGRLNFRTTSGARSAWFEDGRYTVDAQAWDGEGDVEVFVSDASDANDELLPLRSAVLTLAAPVPATVEVRLQPERPASGRVVGPDGRGVADVRLSVQFDASDIGREVSTTRTGDDGSFELRQLGDGTCRLEVDPPKDFVPPQAPLTIRGGERDVVVRLTAAAAGTITVLDLEGKPVRGAVVEVREILAAVGPKESAAKEEDDERPTEPRGLARAVTDGEGRCRVNGIVPGTACALFVSVPANRDDLAPWSALPWTPADVVVRLERLKR